MASVWYPLPVSCQSGDATLLVKCVFETDSYTISVTDLCHLWSEHLDHAGIIKRARESRSSIDPGDAPSQLSKLLEKLKESLRGDQDTELTVVRDTNGSRISISSLNPLPKPLSPLRWIMTLSRLPDDAIRDHILLPLMGVTFVQNKQIEDLVILLREKDNAISKIVDKVESLGIDLINVFPQAGSARIGKKRFQREQVLKQVRGLAAFNREAWNVDFASGLDSMPSYMQVAKTVFAGSDSENVRNVARRLKTFEATADAGSGSQVPARLDREPSRPSELGEFQSQTAPPIASRVKRKESREDHNILHEAKHVKQEAQEENDSDTTEDEAGPPFTEPSISKKADTSARPDYVPTASPAAQLPSTPKKLGLVGARKAKQQPTVNVTETGQDQSSEGNIGGNRQASSPETTPSKPSPTKPLPQGGPGKLGKIGGRRKKTADDHPTSSQAGADTSNGPLIKQETTNNAPIGGPDPPNAQSAVIRGTKPPVEMQGPGRGESRKEATPSPAPEESAEAKADRKRKELKRDMEEKSKTTSKKKRIF